MWCIGELTEEYRQRMYELLELYARPYDPREPVICLDEKSKQLLLETRRPLPLKAAVPARQDYEYERAGTCNIFLAVEPARSAALYAGHRPAHQNRLCRLRLQAAAARLHQGA
jgi:hypothetical protein